ncbi:MAG: hypothetical protein AAF518_09755 [Spirochaetota bacterium]
MKRTAILLICCLTLSLPANHATLKKVKKALQVTNVYQKIDSLRLSKSRRYLAIMRTQDTDTWIDILYVSELLRKKREKKLIRLDAYPSSISGKRWVHKGFLFRSNANFVFCNPLHQKPILQMVTTETFLYDPNKRKIIPEKKLLTSPIWYYAKVLTSVKQKQRSLALLQLVKIYRIIKFRKNKHKEDWEALSKGIFHTPKGQIGYLESWLQKAYNLEHRKDLKKAIKLLYMIGEKME